MSAESTADIEREIADRRQGSAFLFDLDGTLIDSVYQHVVAWRDALEEVGISLAVWKIHRRIGMSGGLFINALARELGTDLDSETAERLRTLHSDAYIRQIDSVRPLPGAIDLLSALTGLGVPWAIATSGVRALRALRRSTCSSCPATRRWSRAIRSATPSPTPTCS